MTSFEPMSYKSGTVKEVRLRLWQAISEEKVLLTIDAVYALSSASKSYIRLLENIDSPASGNRCSATAGTGIRFKPVDIRRIHATGTVTAKVWGKRRRQHEKTIKKCCMDDLLLSSDMSDITPAFTKGARFFNYIS